jgi:hypothetical protein
MRTQGEFLSAPYTRLRSCGITRLKGGNNAAQGNAPLPLN